MSERQTIVVDVETNGLDPDRHVAVEVAWSNLDTGESGSFIPAHHVPDVLAAADIQALQINRYVDRLATAAQDRSGEATRALWNQLHGNTLAGCNPAFDAAFLAKMFRDSRIDFVAYQAWHHRLADLSAYAAGALGLAPGALPGLSDVCQMLGVEQIDPHTALGDVAATVACFAQLMWPRRHVLGTASVDVAAVSGE
jgi:DNA polymerase-3 subunit epsilon